MAKCTTCGRPAGFMMSACDACMENHRRSSGFGAVPQGDAAPKANAARQPGARRTENGYTVLGRTLLVVGLFGMVFAMMLETTVETVPNYAAGEYTGNDVHNIGLISGKLYWLVACGFWAITGAVLLAVGVLKDLAAINPAQRTAPASPAPAPPPRAP